jgi:hypothetical protein
MKASARRHDSRPGGHSGVGIQIGPSDQNTTSRVRTLSALAEHARWDAAVRRMDLCLGDRLLVKTRNSVYSLWFLGGDTFAVSGGWFDQHGISPARMRVNGCTYGGTAIRHDVIAGAGLYLEFGNNVLTTRIQDVRVLRSAEQTATAGCH